MESNKIIIGLLIAIILILLFAVGYFALSNQNNNLNVVNNTTNVTNSINTTNITNSTDNDNSQSNDGSSSQKSSSQQESSSKQYDNWQRDYETGDYDEQGSPIHRSVYSTSGGQDEPGIYEAYWSENGPISGERIG